MVNLMDSQRASHAFRWFVFPQTEQHSLPAAGTFFAVAPPAAYAPPPFAGHILARCPVFPQLRHSAALNLQSAWTTRAARDHATRFPRKYKGLTGFLRTRRLILDDGYQIKKWVNS